MFSLMLRMPMLHTCIILFSFSISINFLMKLLYHLVLKRRHNSFIGILVRRDKKGTSFLCFSFSNPVLTQVFFFSRKMCSQLLQSLACCFRRVRRVRFWGISLNRAVITAVGHSLAGPLLSYRAAHPPPHLCDN